MSFNVSKCKSMIISRKKNHGSLFPPLLLNGSVLEVVPTLNTLVFYFPLTCHGPITSKVFVVKHGNFWVCFTDGIIYQYSDSRSLLQLYISLIRPHLDYAAPVWDPHLQKDINSLESVQNVALKMCFKQWDLGHDGLLELFSIYTFHGKLPP